MKKPPELLQSMLGQVLGSVASKTGSGAPLSPIWETVVGPFVARHARAVSLTNGELLVRVDASQWRDELLRHQADLVTKLAGSLGKDVVRRLRIEVG